MGIFCKKGHYREIISKFKEIMITNLMTIKEIKEVSSLANAGVRESGKAKKEMIEANLRLVISIAKVYKPWTSVFDLIQEGNIGFESR